MFDLVSKRKHDSCGRSPSTGRRLSRFWHFLTGSLGPVSTMSSCDSCWPADTDDESRDFVFLDDLPEEIVMYIFGFLDPAALDAMRLVSRYGRAVAMDESLWRAHFMREFCFVPSSLKCTTWRDEYKLHARILGRTTVWEGMSKWIEPKGHDVEQDTVALITLFPQSTVLTGSGITSNGDRMHEFALSGERTGLLEFRWSKKFGTHVSSYVGVIHPESLTMSGTLSYDDGERMWSGIFRYEMCILAARVVQPQPVPALVVPASNAHALILLPAETENTVEPMRL